MSQNAAKTRLYVPEPLSLGAEIQLSFDHAHSLGNVLRLKLDDPVALFNSNDGEWVGPLTTLKKRNAVITIDQQTRSAEPEPGPWLVFAPLKKTRTQMVIEKATELGVERILPVITENTIGGRINRDRMVANAIEAAEQCERLSVPDIAEAQSLDDLLSSWPEDRCLLVGDETGTGEPIAAVLSSKGHRFQDYGIVIGPEGGFQPDELKTLKTRGFTTLIDLGPRILRAETAVISTLACLMALT